MTQGWLATVRPMRRHCRSETSRVATGDGSFEVLGRWTDQADSN